MNYKKRKRVLALGLAVLLSVPTSVYGGAMEVHAAEEQELSAEESFEIQQEEETEESVSDKKIKEVNDDLSDKEVIECLSSEEEQGGQSSSAGEKKEEVETQNPEETKEAQDTVESEVQEEVQDTTAQDEQKEAPVEETAQDEQKEAPVEETAQDEEKAVVLETKKAAPTEVTKTEVGYNDELNLEFGDTEWLDSITALKVGDDSFEKVNSFGFWESGNKFIAGSFYFDGGAHGDLPALRIIIKNITFPATMVISADGYEDLILNVTKERVGYNYVYTAEVVTDTTPDVPVGQIYTVTTSECTNGLLAVTPSTEVAENTTVTVTATPNEGYEVGKVTATQADNTEVALTEDTEKTGIYTFTMPASNVTVSATFKDAAPVEAGEVALSQLKLTQDMFGQTWYLTVENANDYVSAVTGVKVNGTSWEAKSYGVSSSGAYRKNTDANRLEFAAKDFSSSSTIPVLKSGDVITITAKGYKDLTFKLVIDPNGNASLVEDDNQGDPYELHVKIEGSFEAAIVGQKDYDGVSSASTGGASSNKNSAVTVYGALVKKDTDPADSDWEELDNMSKVSLNGSKCSVSIVPDVENGTSAGSDSGMEGVYMTISSALTLNGTPKDPGAYLISVSVEDQQGRKATSNTLPFRIYTGGETLAGQIKTENLKRYESGLYAWDIMEPWVIEKFGSNVDGQEESVRVPEKLEAWFGSHESGTYGYLGYDIPWADVKADNIPQILYIPNGCNLTLTNMEILSSVRIIVENGGKLTLSDSVVQGIIDVQSGGTFSMNYDSYSNEFTTGASLCGQLRLEDGATLENAAIYSHINYLANGDLTDRNSDEAVVVATGNVTLKGQVFIEGDSAGGSKGQAALKVKDGTLTLEDGATLVAYGGDGKVLLYSEGGDAIQLENSTVEGNGKVAAIGGDVLWGSGGNAVSGNGAIRTTEVFLQGATANSSNKAAPGKAVDGNITITSEKRYVANGTLISGTENDPLEDLYWKTGIDPVPPLDKFTTAATKSFTVSDIPGQVYTGEELQPQIIVTDGGKTLVEGTDYEVTYKQTRRTAAATIDAGTYTVVVSGIGVYGGSVEKAFVIAPKKMTFAVTEDAVSAVYDGQNKRPVVTVKDGDNVLTEGIDYTITVSVDGKEYTNAEFVAAGVYQMAITGIGNYEGSTGKVSFTISEKSSDQNNNGNTNNGNGADNGSNADNSNSANNGSNVDNGNNTNNNTTNNSKKKKKHSSHSHAPEETAVQTAAAENTAATDVTAVPATGDTAQTEQWMLLSAVSLAALSIFLENKRKKRNEN